MNVSKDITRSIKQASKARTEAYDTAATVRRIEGDTVWVHIPGGVDETPVMFTVDCRVGDDVILRVANGKAWITGNATAPPTDNTVANAARAVADKATEIATKAEQVSGNTTNYFWNDAKGTHVATTEGAGMTDYNILGDFAGITVRHDSDEIIKADTSGVSIQTNTKTEDAVKKFSFNQSGTLTLPAAPSANMDAATKQYVDAGLQKKCDTTEVDNKINALHKVYSGTAEPSSGLGKDGDVYIQY